jgi:hypothetical protein
MRGVWFCLGRYGGKLSPPVPPERWTFSNPCWLASWRLSGLLADCLVWLCPFARSLRSCFRRPVTSDFLLERTPAKILVALRSRWPAPLDARPVAQATEKAKGNRPAASDRPAGVHCSSASPHFIYPLHLHFGHLYYKEFGDRSSVEGRGLDFHRLSAVTLRRASQPTSNTRSPSTPSRSSSTSLSSRSS